MTNLEIVNLNEAIKAHLEQLKNLSGSKFTYALLKNSGKLQKEADDIVAANKRIPEFEQYEQKRIETCIKHTPKNEDGTPKTREGTFGNLEYDLDRENPEFKAAIDALRVEYKESLDKQDKLFKEFQMLLQAENEEFKLHLVSIQDVPEAVTTELMSVLLPMIKED